SSEDDDFEPEPQHVFRTRRAHDDEAGGSSLPGQREAESPIPPISTSQVTQPDALASVIQSLADQSKATMEMQREMQAQFQR
ncbi:hypothetical protein PSY31_23645, partial [Shigella flexneri]|nr:hypothetical protein [Shigella flexneri]